MSFLRNSKKVLKFTFVKMPVGVLGVNQLRLGNEHLRDLWHSFRGVVCPSCKSGTLLCKKDTEESSDNPSKKDQKKCVLYPWACTNCDFMLLEAANIRVVKQAVRELLKKEAIAHLGQMEVNARRQRARHFIIRSRVFFLLGLAPLTFFFYELAKGGSFLFSAYLLSFGVTSTIVALKASYRAWQVETGTVFIEGTFLNWLKHERWFR